MSNPDNLPVLTGGLTFDEFQVAHLGPTDGRQDEAHWTAEAVLVTLESHYWLPSYANSSYSMDTSDKLEQLSDWVANWAEYGAEAMAEDEPVEIPTLAQWLRDNLVAIVEDGFYRAGPEGLKAAADLMECLDYLEEGYY